MVSHPRLRQALLRWLDVRDDGKDIVKLDDKRYAYVEIDIVRANSARWEGDRVTVLWDEERESGGGARLRASPPGRRQRALHDRARQAQRPDRHFRTTQSRTPSSRSPAASRSRPPATVRHRATQRFTRCLLSAAAPMANPQPSVMASFSRRSPCGNSSRSAGPSRRTGPRYYGRKLYYTTENEDLAARRGRRRKYLTATRSALLAERDTCQRV